MTMIRQAPANTSGCADGPGASHGLRAIDQDLHGVKERYLDDPRRTREDPSRLRSSVRTRKIQRRAGKGCRIHLKETHWTIGCRRPCRLKTARKLTQKKRQPGGIPAGAGGWAERRSPYPTFLSFKKNFFASSAEETQAMWPPSFCSFRTKSS